MVRLLLFVRLLLNYYRAWIKDNTLPDPENDSHDAICTRGADDLNDAEARAAQEYLKNVSMNEVSRSIEKCNRGNIRNMRKKYTVQHNATFVRTV